MYKTKSSQSGNAVLAVLAVVAIIAVGIGAYFYGQVSGQKMALGTDTVAEESVVSEINPVVAKVDGKNVTRAEVFSFIRALPENLRVVPLDKIYPVALEQVIGDKLVEARVEKAGLDSDPEVLEKLAQAKKQIMRAVYLEREAERRITAQKTEEAYKEYVEKFPDREEVQARHIVLKEEKEAKDIIKKLKDGAEFEALAKEVSIDPTTASKGGDLGYFVKKDVLPEFGEAVYKLKVGEYTDKPVKTSFGWHVIKLEDKRKQAPRKLEEVQAAIQGSLRPGVMEQAFREWREEATLERFNINGEALEPAAGESADGGEDLIPKTGAAKEEKE